MNIYRIIFNYFLCRFMATPHGKLISVCYILNSWCNVDYIFARKQSYPIILFLGGQDYGMLSFYVMGEHLYNNIWLVPASIHGYTQGEANCCYIIDCRCNVDYIRQEKILSHNCVLCGRNYGMLSFYAMDGSDIIMFD